MCSILEYGAACWDPYGDGQVIALDLEQKKAFKFGSHTSDSVRETLAQRSEIGRICALLKAYPGERVWKCTGDSLQGPCHLSREDQDLKIRGRSQRTGIGRYFFVNRTLNLWNQLLSEVLATLSCKSHSFRKRSRKLFTDKRNLRRWRNFFKKMEWIEVEWKILWSECSIYL